VDASGRVRRRDLPVVVVLVGGPRDAEARLGRLPGAAASGFEQDASTRDGVHNTRAVYRSLREHCYGPGDDLFLMSYPGHHHNAQSWAARIATPLQIFFPRSL
jgi:hypothetical protein